MPISELLVPELDAEMKKTRTALERVPAGGMHSDHVVGSLGRHGGQLVTAGTVR